MDKERRMNNKNELKFEDLILDEVFISYVKGKCKDSDGWNERFRNNDNLALEANKAKELIQALENNHQAEPFINKEIAANILIQKINFEDKLTRNKKPLNIFYYKHWMVAASVSLVIVAICLTFFIKPLGLAGADEVKYNEIIVPLGEKTELVLTDGSKIWLNSETRFRYPESFSKNTRDVYLEGEAFFDVIKNPKKPFIVHANEVNIKVLGTEFNLKNYPYDNTLETTVVKGKVLLSQADENYIFSPVVLNMNEKAVLFKNDKKLTVESTLKRELNQSKNTPVKDIVISKKPSITIKKVNTEPVISWKDHLLIFDNEPLGDMATKMTRWYKMQVTIQDTTLLNERYTGKFVNNETIYQVLEAIKLTTPIQFEAIDNQILITRRKK